MFDNRYERIESDGLNSMKYKIIQLRKKILFTWILVDIEHVRVSCSIKIEKKVF